MTTFVDLDVTLPIWYRVPLTGRMDGYTMEAHATTTQGEPRVNVVRVGPMEGRVSQSMSPEEAEALGMHLIRAALAAKLLAGTAA